MGRIRIAVQGDQADPAFVATWKGYRNHLETITGVAVQTFQTSDYNSVIQAIASGQVDAATLGAGAYANVDAQVGGKVVPYLTSRQPEGTVGYYSALMVRSDSPFHSVADLKGKSIAYIDFNSTSGYIFPRMALARQGFTPDRYFGKSIMAGGGTQALLAVVNRRVDAAMTTASGGTPATGFTAGNLVTLARRGVLKRDDVRMIWTAGPMPNEPFIIRTDRPQAFVDVMRGAMAMLPYERPDIWEQMGQLPGGSLKPATRKTYEAIIAMHNAEIQRQRSGGGA